MSQGTARRTLIAAIALSILIHLLGVRFVHWAVPSPQAAPETTTVSRIAVIRRIPHTPPPQTPQPQSSPQPTPRIAVKHIQVPHTLSRTGPPRVRLTPRSVAISASPRPTPARRVTPVPSASPSPKSGCAVANAPAAVKTLAPVPEMSVAARQSAKGGTARIHLRLSETGDVLEAAILASSGSDAQDQIALAQAKSSAYSPALAQCKAVAATYDFTAKFVIP
ncbi:MAG: energy transducer TonB [Candidatus Eremiobacteraeota bacterium]|nr:energy transducer TonB [Candidatus Eremiobacteraeota bacterium]